MIPIRKKKKKVRVYKNKVHCREVDTLPDAFVDGKFVVELKERIMVQRYSSCGDTLSLCTLWKIDGNKVTFWDETREQWYGIDTTQTLPMMKLLPTRNVVRRQKVDDSVVRDEKPDTEHVCGYEGRDTDETTVDCDSGSTRVAGVSSDIDVESPHVTTVDVVEKVP